MLNFETKIRRLINIAGFDLHRLRPSLNPAFQLLKGLDHFKVDLVLDIGANIGQFASDLRSVGYQGQVVSFEPLTDAHQLLKAKAAKDRSWIIHQRCAIGDFDGEIDINIAGNSLSSSVLPMLETHAAAASGSSYIGTEKAPIYQLDSVAAAYVRKAHRYFVKIDTQGFEWQVLDGGSKTLEWAQGVMCEMSLVSLYEGQHLWMDILHRFTGMGFALWSIQQVFTDPRHGRTLQIDATFFRTGSDVRDSL